MDRIIGGIFKFWLILVLLCSINFLGGFAEPVNALAIDDGGESNVEESQSPQNVDQTPPEISNIQVTALAKTEATFSWQTDEAATSQAEFGEQQNLDKMTPEYDLNPMVTAHSVTISLLECNTSYNYRVKSKDSAGNAGQSALSAYTTSPCMAPEETVSQTIINGSSPSQTSEGPIEPAAPLTPSSPAPTEPSEPSTPPPNPETPPSSTPTPTAPSEPAQPAPIDQTNGAIIPEVAVITEKAAGIADEFLSKLNKIFKPLAPAAEPAGVMSAAAATIATVAAGASGLLGSSSTVLNRLLNGPGFFALFAGRRKKSWGQVLDRQTGVAVPGAIIILDDARENRSIDQQTTDIEGRFLFLVGRPGMFRLRVNHKKYRTFVSKVFSINNIDEIPDLGDIFIDRMDAKSGFGPGIINNVFNFLEHLRLPILIIGTIALATRVLAQGVAGLQWLLGLYSLLWALEIWLQLRPRPWGKIVDNITNAPIARAILRLIDADKKILVRTVVSGASGKFAFLAPKGNFKLQVVAPQYQPFYQTGVKLSAHKSFINETIKLNKLAAQPVVHNISVASSKIPAVPSPTTAPAQTDASARIFYPTQFIGQTTLKTAQPQSGQDVAPTERVD